MQFDSFSEFLAMGHHGLYVWMAYGLAFLIIILNWVLPVMKRKSTLKALARQVQRERLREQQERTS